MHITLMERMPDVAEGARVFSALAQDGKVQMPFQPTFWAKGFGMDGLKGRRE